MSKNKRPNRRTPRTPAVFLVMFLAAAVVAGLAAYVKLTPADTVPEGLSRRNEASQRGNKPAASNREGDQSSVWVPVPVFNDQVLGFEESEVSVPAGVDPKVAAVNAFLKASRVADPGAEVLGVDVRGGTAHLDFNEAFRTGMGSMDEATLISGLCATLGQFPDVLRIELYVGGERVQELGHLDLSEPQGVIRRADWSPKPVEIPPTGQER